MAAGLDPTTAPKRLKLGFAYDAQHRRIAKVVKEWHGDPVGGAFTVVKDRRYVYNGWNMIAESSRGTEARWTDGAAGCPAGVRARAERPNQLDHTTATGNGLEGSTVVRTQVWGQDLSGTMQGAGGVSGLLAVRHGGQTYVPLMDGNGNVMGLQGLGGAKDGQTVARYDYDAFGNRITNTAPELGEEVNPFGFSTKFTDEETGLVYYGYRYYAPEGGRWLSRDPIGERGGINLYGMVGNDAVNRWDLLGLNPDTVAINWAATFYRGLGGEVKVTGEVSKCLCTNGGYQCTLSGKVHLEAGIGFGGATNGALSERIGGYVKIPVFNKDINLTGKAGCGGSQEVTVTDSGHVDLSLKFGLGSGLFGGEHSMFSLRGGWEFSGKYVVDSHVLHLKGKFFIDGDEGGGEAGLGPFTVPISPNERFPRDEWVLFDWIVRL